MRNVRQKVIDGYLPTQEGRSLLAAALATPMQTRLSAKQGPGFHRKFFKEHTVKSLKGGLLKPVEIPLSGTFWVDNTKDGRLLDNFQNKVVEDFSRQGVLSQ
jgi:hypothetical protein